MGGGGSLSHKTRLSVSYCWSTADPWCRFTSAITQSRGENPLSIKETKVGRERAGEGRGFKSPRIKNVHAYYIYIYAHTYVCVHGKMSMRARAWLYSAMRANNNVPGGKEIVACSLALYICILHIIYTNAICAYKRDSARYGSFTRIRCEFVNMA